MGEIAGAQAQSAKTFENQAAEAALQGTRSIETSGQQQEHNAGGPLGAQFNTALQAGKNLLGGIGQAGVQGTVGRQESESGFLANIRANAVARFDQTNAGVASGYARSREKEEGSYQKARASLAGKLKSEEVVQGDKIGQAKYAEELKAQELGPKNAARLSTTEKNRAEIGDKSRKLGIEEQNSASKRETEATTRTKNLADAKKAEAYAKNGPSKGTSSAEVKARRTFANELQAAFHYWNQWGSSGGLKTNKEMEHKEEALRQGFHYEKVGQTAKERKVSNLKVRGVVSEAAREMHYKGHLTRQTQRELEATTGWKGTSQQLKKEILGG